MCECVGIDVGWKGEGGEAEKGMVLDSSATPCRSREGASIPNGETFILPSLGALPGGRQRCLPLSRRRAAADVGPALAGAGPGTIP